MVGIPSDFDSGPSGFNRDAVRSRPLTGGRLSGYPIERMDLDYQKRWFDRFDRFEKRSCFQAKDLREISLSEMKGRLQPRRPLDRLSTERISWCLL